MTITVEVSSRDGIASSFLDGDITAEEDDVVWYYYLWYCIVICGSQVGNREGFQLDSLLVAVYVRFSLWRREGSEREI